MSKQNLYWKERYVYIVLIILSILVFLITPKQVQEGASRWVPYFSISIVLIGSITCLINCFRKREKILSFPKAPFLMLLTGVLLYCLYVFLINFVGFYSLSVIFIALILYLFKKRNVKTMILTSVITPFVLYLLLEQLLGLSLPSGFMN